MEKYYVKYFEDGVQNVKGFEKNKEAKIFASLVNGSIYEYYKKNNLKGEKNMKNYKLYQNNERSCDLVVIGYQQVKELFKKEMNMCCLSDHGEYGFGYVRALKYVGVITAEEHEKCIDELCTCWEERIKELDAINEILCDIE